MEEVWKDIDGYKRLYQVSNLGNVRSLDRWYRNGRHYKGKPMKLTPNKAGYLTVTLHDWNGYAKTYWVSRLVAIAFIPNPDNKPQVGHKDESKTNNHVDNLEWVTSKENCNMPLRRQRLAEANIGKKASDETRLKLSKYRRGRKRGEAFRQKCMETNAKAISVLCEGVKYRSINQCAIHYNKNESTLSFYLKHPDKMPQKWKDLGLQYYQPLSEVDNIDNTARNEDGFGSSGK